MAAVSVGPEVPTESSMGVPVGGFSKWFRNIYDWIKELSPSGASLFESGEAITPFAGISASNGLSIYRYGKMVTLEGQVKRDAGIFPAGGTQVFALPAEFRPRGYRRLILPLYGSTANGGSLLANVSSTDGIVSVQSNGTGADIAYFCHSWKVA